MARPITGNVRAVERKDPVTGVTVTRFELRVRGKALGTYPTREAAFEHLDAYLLLEKTEQEQADQVPPEEREGVVTVANYAPGFFDAREKSGAYKRVDQERSVFRMHIATAKFAHRPVQRITPKQIKEWVLELYDKKAVTARTVGRRYGQQKKIVHTETERALSRKTIRNVRGLLRELFKACRVDYPKLFPYGNPVEDVEVLSRADAHDSEDESGPWTFLTLEEIARFLGSLPSPRHRAFFALAIYAGLRQGEIVGLRWRDVDFGGSPGADGLSYPRLRVRKSYSGSVKTTHSKRTVYMLKVLQTVLREYRDVVERTRRLGQRNVIALDELVFPSDRGPTWCYAQGYDMGWSDRRYRKKQDGPVHIYPGLKTRAGLRDEVCFHDLRHTNASHLVMGHFGIRPLSLYEVKAWLGHSDISVTQRYAHLCPSSFQAEVARQEGPTDLEVAARVALADR